MIVYTKNEINKSEDYYCLYKHLLNYESPILFPAENTVETISLILFLFENGKSFFPINPDLPARELNAILQNVGGTFFNLKDGQVVSQSHCMLDVGSTLYLQTTGTTKEPKIALLSFKNIYYSAIGSIHFFGLTSKDTWQLSIPLFHVGGLMALFRLFYVNGSVSVIDIKERFFHQKTTFVSLVPTQLYRLLHYNHPCPSSIKGLLIGGAPCSNPLITRSKKLSLPVYLTYGMTEMSSQITCGYYNTGKPLDFRELLIAEDGEILVKGPCLFSGYLKDGKLSLPVDQKGYFRTNDVGFYSQTNGLCITGRKDRQFISGGENIQPEEIERILISLFDLTYCKIEPAPCEEFGNKAIAYLYPFPTLTQEEIKIHLKEYLPRYKVPKEFKEGNPSKTFKNLL